MNELELKDDYVTSIKLLLIQQFKNKPNLEAFLGVIGTQMQSIENVFLDMLQARWLDNATGDQLDGIGAIVGEERAGLDDDAYSLRIRVRIKINLSSGTPEESLAIVRLLAGDVQTILFTEFYPASYVIELTGTSSETLAEEIGRAVLAAHPAGVHTSLIYSTDELSDMFTFADSTSVQADTARGFADFETIGSVWTARTPTGLSSSRIISHVVFREGSNNTLATDGLVISSSGDYGETWSSAYTHSGATIASLFYDGTQWVMGDSLGDVYTSPTGVTWTLQGNITGFPGFASTVDIKKVGSRYVATVYSLFTSGVELFYSTNLIAWTDSGDGGAFGGSIYNNAVIQVIGNLAFELHSFKLTTDFGSNWAIPTGISGSDFMRAVAFGNSVYIAVGHGPDSGGFHQPVTRYSADTDFDSGGYTDVVTAGFNNKHVHDITFGAGVFVIVGELGKIAWCTDGTDWTASTFTGSAPTDDFHAIEYLDSGAGTFIFVAVGANGLLAVSSDGKDWAVVSLGTTEDLSPPSVNSGITHGRGIAGNLLNDSILVYGENRALFQSQGGGVGTAGGLLSGVISNG